MNKDKKIPDHEILETLLHTFRIKPMHLAKKIDVHHNVIYAVLDPNREYNMSQDVIDKIMIAYPNVNYWYLAKGEGSPLKNDDAGVQTQKNVFSDSGAEISLSQIHEKIEDAKTFAKQAMVSVQDVPEMRKDIAEIKTMLRELIDVIKK